ncbi:MAG: TraR/DksA family transcriptional regulator [Candidatus Paceibacterota bacterium]
MIDTEKFKEKLLKEKTLLEKELADMGHVNPNNPSDWVADPEKGNGPQESADKNLAADRQEDYEERVAITETLEERLNNVRGALSRINEGTYGICSVGGGRVEEKRLEANPAATTCTKHLN